MMIESEGFIAEAAIAVSGRNSRPSNKLGTSFSDSPVLDTVLVMSSIRNVAVKSSVSMSGNVNESMEVECRCENDGGRGEDVAGISRLLSPFSCAMEN